MSTRDSIIEQGRRKGEAASRQFVSEVREARLNLGKSQATAARQAGVDRSVWTRIERGQRAVPDWEVAGRMAAAVGLDLSVQLYPASRILRDEGHVILLRDGRVALGPGWHWRYEVPTDSSGQRAWDAVAQHRESGLEVEIEAEVQLRDIQALCRRLRTKRGASGSRRVLLLVRDGVRNRIAVREAALIVGTEFPVPAREALRALRAGMDPGGDACILLRRDVAAKPNG